MLDHHRWLHGHALLKSTMLQEVPFTSQTLWICRCRTIFQLMAVKGLEKKAPFWVLHKVEVWAVKGSAFYTAEHFQEPVQVDNLPCVHYLHAHPTGLLDIGWNTWPEGRGCENLDGKLSLVTLGGHCIEPVLNMRQAPWDGTGKARSPEQRGRGCLDGTGLRLEVEF